MWYAAGAASIERAGGPIARRLLDAARLAWPTIAVDLQRLTLAPGESAVSPGERPIHDHRWCATGSDDPVLLLVEAAHPLLTIDGVPFAGDGVPRLVKASAVSRGLAWPDDAEPREVTLALARRAAPSELLDRPRRSPRAFVPRPGEARETLPAWAAERALRYHSDYRVIGPLGPFDPEVIAAEPMPIAAHPTWVAEHGGPIGRAFVAALPADWRTPDADVIVNGKLNEFDPGWSSCLVGFHIDGTSRIRKRADGLPDLLDPGPTIEQIGCSVGPAGATGFLRGPLALPVAPIGEDGRGVWQRIITDAIADGTVEAVRGPSDTVVAFDHGDFHTCMPAERDGWRFFIKAMRGRGDTPTNAFREHCRISWPLDAGAWPDAPLGVFPPTLPFFAGSRAA